MGALYICAVVVWGIALARIDFAEHRLPDRLTLPAIPGFLAIISTAWPTHIPGALQWAIVFGGIATILAVVADVGWGDVKLLVVLGLFAGGSGTIVDAVLSICVIGGVQVLIHLAVDGDRTTFIPFGPAILVGFLPGASALA